MARRPRLEFPSTPARVVQRGNNRLPCFFHDDDYCAYLESLQESSVNTGVHVHAYVLMTNHVHLLLTAHAPHAVSHMMQALGRRYVRYINGVYRRTGTLWEGRFKSSLIDTRSYLLTCYRYIELNPVRAAMIASPAMYRWSSYARNALGAPQRLVTPHPEYTALGSSDSQRCAAYRELFQAALDAAIWPLFALTSSKSVRWAARAFRRKSKPHSRDPCACAGRDDRANWRSPQVKIFSDPVFAVAEYTFL